MGCGVVERHLEMAQPKKYYCRTVRSDLPTKVQIVSLFFFQVLKNKDEDVEKGQLLKQQQCCVYLSLAMSSSSKTNEI